MQLIMYNPSLAFNPIFRIKLLQYKLRGGAVRKFNIVLSKCFAPRTGFYNEPTLVLFCNNQHIDEVSCDGHNNEVTFAI